MKRFILTTRARQDVNDIWDYIAGDNIGAADRVLDALNNAMVKLAKSPGIGLAGPMILANSRSNSGES